MTLSRDAVHSSEIAEQLAAMVEQFPASFANQLEMLRHTKTIEEEKRALIDNEDRMATEV